MAVFLQSKTNGSEHVSLDVGGDETSSSAVVGGEVSGSGVIGDDTSSSDAGGSDISTSSDGTRWSATGETEPIVVPHTHSFDSPWIVITRIRAQYIFSGLKRIPIGFYVLVRFDGHQRRTQTKSIQLHGSSIEWEDNIVLPCKALAPVRFTVYASFELDPTLGDGETLYTSECRAEELIGGTYLITSPGECSTAVLHPSLLVTLGQWYYSRCPAAATSDDHSNLDSEESSVLIRETNLGREALVRYRNKYRRSDLENAVQHFQCAWQKCRPTHQCYAVVLVNLAEAMFISCQADSTSANLEEAIQLYHQALNLRSPGHLDRPATLLQFAQTLLFRYEKQGYDGSIADEINELMTEFRDFSAGSHERQAADLVLETLKRYRVVESGSIAELSELVQELKLSVKVLPDGYFDRPQRLINIGTTLRRLLEISEDLSYLRDFILLSEEALHLIPEGHPDRQFWVTNSTTYLAETFECLGDLAFEAGKYDEMRARYSQAISVVVNSLTTHQDYL